MLNGVLAGLTNLGLCCATMSSEDPEHFREIAPTLEFMCWIAVMLVPFLRLVNGPAVTDDQFYIQCSLAVTAIVGAVSLRIFNWRNR
jgi:hypothetical protein